MSDTRFLVTILNRETGETYAFDAERLVQVLGLRREGDACEMWCVGLQHVTGEDIASGIATLLDNVVERYGTRILDRIVELSCRVPILQQEIQVPGGPATGRS